MTRLFLAAGVAALAIAVPASAKPGEHGGGKGGGAVAAAPNRGGGNVRAPSGGGGGRAMQMQRAPRGGGNFQMRAAERHGGNFSAPRAQRQAFSMDRGRGHGGGFAAPRAQRQSFASSDRGRGHAQVQRQHGNAVRMTGGERRIERANGHARRVEQVRNIERQRGRADRTQQVQNRILERGHMQDQRLADRAVLRDGVRGDQLERIGTRDWQNADRWANARGLANGCPPGLWAKNNGCLPPGQAKKLFGQSIRDAERFTPLNELPLGMRTFYPDTSDYYYRYGDGYLYRVDRGNDLISALLPLVGGGYLPGMAFPSAYNYNYAPGYTFPTGFADPYVSDYYGFNAFYPDTQYVDYRYLNGNVYGVDPYSGMINNVIPTYAYGYGVGQVLPASYGYYNVPYQYRDLYYDTSDYNYWYAPGAIYQVDPSSQMITSVASLLSPGLSIGQPLPLGYDVYNVPYDYRATYYDTPNAWYRYNNGSIYQVDPTTRLVTALVASLLT